MAVHIADRGWKRYEGNRWLSKRFQRSARGFLEKPCKAVQRGVLRRVGPADIEDMVRETVQAFQTVRPAPERRVNADRRLAWRGGRRDSDWTIRPPGALELMEREARPMTAWHRGWSSIVWARLIR